MKRLMTAVSLVMLSASAASAAATPAPTPSHHKVVKTAAKPVIPHVVFLKYRVAPADEYFGKLKMSILGIRNTIRDLQANIEIDQARWTGLVNKADFTEDAVHDWEHKYPKD